jgi:septal ring-binding cell division protein DamX
MSPIYSKAGLVLTLVTTSVILTACSGSVPGKRESIWDQRRDSNTVSAPAAAEYKQELAEVDQSTSDVELSYQAEQVESFAADNTAESEFQSSEAIEPEAVETAAVASESKASGVEQEILALPVTHYTVQLFASVDIDRVYKFAEQNQISVQYVVPTIRDDIIWYVLLLDMYPDYSMAKASMEEIAPSLKTQPWVRSVGSVQKLIQ